MDRAEVSTRCRTPRVSILNAALTFNVKGSVEAVNVTLEEALASGLLCRTSAAGSQNMLKYYWSLNITVDDMRVLLASDSSFERGIGPQAPP